MDKEWIISLPPLTWVIRLDGKLDLYVIELDKNYKTLKGWQKLNPISDNDKTRIAAL